MPNPHIQYFSDVVEIALTDSDSMNSIGQTLQNMVKQAGIRFPTVKRMKITLLGKHFHNSDDVDIFKYLSNSVEEIEIDLSVSSIVVKSNSLFTFNFNASREYTSLAILIKGGNINSKNAKATCFNITNSVTAFYSIKFEHVRVDGFSRHVFTSNINEVIIQNSVFTSLFGHGGIDSCSIFCGSADNVSITQNIFYEIGKAGLPNEKATGKTTILINNPKCYSLVARNAFLSGEGTAVDIFEGSSIIRENIFIDYDKGIVVCAKPTTSPIDRNIPMISTLRNLFIFTDVPGAYANLQVGHISGNMVLFSNKNTTGQFYFFVGPDIQNLTDVEKKKFAGIFSFKNNTGLFINGAFLKDGLALQVPQDATFIVDAEDMVEDIDRDDYGNVPAYFFVDNGVPAPKNFTGYKTPDIQPDIDRLCYHLYRNPVTCTEMFNILMAIPQKGAVPNGY